MAPDGFDWTLALGAAAVVGLMMWRWARQQSENGGTANGETLQDRRRRAWDIGRQEPAGHWRVVDGATGETLAEGEPIRRWAERWTGREDELERERRG